MNKNMLILILMILLLFRGNCLPNLSRPKIQNMGTKERERLEKKEWIILEADYELFIDPLNILKILTGAGHELTYNYDEVIYKNENGNLKRWMILRPFASSQKSCYFPNIYWNDEKYLYISTCTGVYEIKSGHEYSFKTNITIFKIDINKKHIVNKKSFACDCSGYYDYILLKNDDNIIVIIPEFKNEAIAHIIQVKSDLSSQINYCLVNHSGCEFNKDKKINIEILNDNLHLKGIDYCGHYVEESLNLKDLEQGKCTVR